MKLKINNITHNVVFVDKIVDGDNEDLGRFFGDSQTIEISKNQNPQRMKATILHEITHAYLYNFGLQAESYDEEFVCNFVELYANQIIKDCEKVCKARKL